MHEFNAECTPMPFFGERQEPNPLQWVRIEQLGKGVGARLFYNEVPQANWFRTQGHRDSVEEELYSFVGGDQDQPIKFGMDTTTEEGRALFKAEYEALCDLAPEILKKEDIVFPHEEQKVLSTEPHFRRLWSHYRCFMVKNYAETLLEQGTITNEEYIGAGKFLGVKGTSIDVSAYVYTKAGLRPALAEDTGFLAADKILSSLTGGSTFSLKTAEDPESQFWKVVDTELSLSEKALKATLPLMITDPKDRIKVKAIVDDSSPTYLEEETTKQLNA